MDTVGWFKDAKKTHCINKTNLECGGVIELPRALDENEPFISTNLEKRDDHDAGGWIDCPNGCGFSVWLAPSAG